MSLTHLYVPANRAGMVTYECSKFGLEVELDKEGSDDSRAYFFVYGDEEKADMVALHAGAEVIDQTISIPGEPGGVGVEVEGSDREKIYAAARLTPAR